MSSILDVEFTLENKRTRLGYYYSTNGIKGHAFHYTKPIDTKNGVDILSKLENQKGEIGAWKKIILMEHTYIQCLEIISIY